MARKKTKQMHTKLESKNRAARSWLHRLVRRICAPKPKRLELKLATYSEAEGLLKQGWTLAPEEDRNHAIGLVYLERLDSPNVRFSDSPSDSADNTKTP